MKKLLIIIIFMSEIINIYSFIPILNPNPKPKLLLFDNNNYQIRRISNNNNNDNNDNNKKVIIGNYSNYYYYSNITYKCQCQFHFHYHASNNTKININTYLILFIFIFNILQNFKFILFNMIIYIIPFLLYLNYVNCHFHNLLQLLKKVKIH
jgi:hypothetical protein